MGNSRAHNLARLQAQEDEDVAATHAAKEAIWLCKLIGELFPSILLPITLYCDNQPALKLAQDDNFRARTKHIDLRYHFIRQVVAKGVLCLVYCPTEDMAADMLTKALPKWKVKAHITTLGLHHNCGGVMENAPSGAAVSFSS